MSYGANTPLPPSPSPRQGATLIHACQKNHSIHTIHTDELYTRTVPAPPSSPTETTRTPLYLLSRRQLTRVVNRPCLPMLKTSVLGEADIQCIGEADTTYRRCIGRAQRGFGHIGFISLRTKPIFNTSAQQIQHTAGVSGELSEVLAIFGSFLSARSQYSTSVGAVDTIYRRYIGRARRVFLAMLGSFFFAVRVKLKFCD